MKTYTNCKNRYVYIIMNIITNIHTLVLVVKYEATSGIELQSVVKINLKMERTSIL